MIPTAIVGENDIVLRDGVFVIENCLRVKAYGSTIIYMRKLRLTGAILREIL